MFRRRATRRGFGAGPAAGRRGSPLRRGALGRSLGIVLCSAAVVTSPVSLASPEVLLGNLDESAGARIPVGVPADSPSVEFTQAIRFQTGSNERGYNLTSVKAVLANTAAADGVRVRIFGARSIGTPYLSFYTLSNPVIADGTLTFTAPASATLRKDAGYFVVFDSTASDAGNGYEVRGTESDSLNTVADGWSLNADRHSRNGDSASWTTASAVPLIEISGEALVQATDANLKALRMRDGNGKLVTYSPFFDSAITSYGTTTSPKVDRITIQTTASNADGAEVDYLDGDDQLLTDADAVKDGFQVDLDFGPKHDQRAGDRRGRQHDADLHHGGDAGAVEGVGGCAGQQSGRALQQEAFHRQSRARQDLAATRRWDSKPAAMKQATCSPRSRSSSGRSRIRPACG